MFLIKIEYKSPILLSTENPLNPPCNQREPFIKKIKAMKKISEILVELNELEVNNLRHKSFKSYESKIRIFCQWLKDNNLDNTPISEFNYILAKKFLNGLERDAETRRSYQRTLNKYFKELIRMGEITKNPFENMRLPKSTHPKRLRAFLRKEIDLIKNYCIEEDAEMWLFIQMMFYTLIRPNELRNLQIKDIDLENNKIWIQGEVSKNRRKQAVLIPQHFQPILAQLIKDKPLHHFLFGGAKMRGENYFNYRHNQILKSLHIKTKDISLYSWKHTGAVLFYLATKDLIGLMNQCRHTSPDITNGYLKSIGYLENPEIRYNYPTL